VINSGKYEPLVRMELQEEFISTPVGKKIIVLHVFIKKTQKTPPAALQMATRRAKQAKLI
jgi:hypothetical protein